MSDDLIEMQRRIDTLSRMLQEDQDDLARLRAEVERLKAQRDVASHNARHYADLCVAAETALSDERRHADEMARAAEMLDTHAVAIHDADGKCYSVRARDYARLFDALAQHRARRQS
ncbi:hypothetical protein GL279_00480 [Paracoccus limosus]|uniref:Uncharacterized protein n=1 Tax=Paracoccus limosus TaxID=913252 RepID=A0A844H0K1_9RHOB|nr:hypothetical protein [Paracoccus limosus]MTH33074.1 hypothetical protein [Paracoccus limosus]